MLRLIAVSLATALAIGVAHAQEKKATPQQQRMAQCNKDATGMKGDERKKFMSDCLSAKTNPQQNRMTECNKKAAGMKGDERKKFMSGCLKG
jgi:hypothetical protein